MPQFNVRHWNPHNLEGSRWLITSNSPYDPYDPTLPLVWYHGPWLYDDFISCSVIAAVSSTRTAVWKEEIELYGSEG